ncbi:MAG: hypothetical protein KAJ55_06780 [Anaerolineales bacterium]|nr:hypothetical protein [Anaerolineales bacterium]
MTEQSTSIFARPTLATKFHIDFEYWDRADRDLNIYLRSHLCPEHQEAYADVEADTLVDSVNPKTAEVTRVRGIQHTLISHCSLQPDYLTPQTTLVNAIFRVFLSNGNSPLAPEELGEILNRPARTILRMLSGGRVYKGIRPLLED